MRCGESLSLGERKEIKKNCFTASLLNGLKIVPKSKEQYLDFAFAGMTKQRFMVDQRLSDYIKQTRAAGMPDADIKKALTDAGWLAEVIDEALAPASFQIQVKEKPTPLVSAEPVLAERSDISKSVTPKTWIFVGIGAVIIFSAVAGGVWYWQSRSAGFSSPLVPVSESIPAATTSTPNTTAITGVDEVSKEGRDETRIADLHTLKSATNLFLLTVPGARLSCSNGKIFSSDEGLISVDGKGWLPVNFSAIEGSPLPHLPVDPLNKDGYVMSFSCNEKKEDFELNVRMESDRFRFGAAAQDEGNNPSVYEIGTDLTIIK